MLKCFSEYYIAVSIILCTLLSQFCNMKSNFTHFIPLPKISSSNIVNSQIAFYPLPIISIFRFYPPSFLEYFLFLFKEYKYTIWASWESCKFRRKWSFVNISLFFSNTVCTLSYCPHCCKESCEEEL